MTSNVTSLSAYRSLPPKATSKTKFGASGKQAISAPVPGPSDVSPNAGVSSVALKDALMGKVRFGNGLFDASVRNVPFSQVGKPPKNEHVDIRTAFFEGATVTSPTASMMPSIIQKTPDGGIFTIDPISWMYNNNIIYLNSGINSASSLSFIAQLDALTTKILRQRAMRQKEAEAAGEGDSENMEDETPKDEIRIYINSPGGSVIDLYGMVDAMKRTQSLGIDIATYVRGMAASAGSVILALGTPGKRYATPNSLVMIHQPLGGAHGQATDIDIENKLIQKMKQKLTRMLSDSTNGKKSYEELLQIMERDTWLEAEEALEYGLIDKIADS